MATLGDSVFDNGLSVLASANKITITSQEVTTYTEGNATYALGNKVGLTVSSPADRTGGGRKVTVSAITSGSVTATGTATHYAVLNTSTSTLLATGSLTASQAVTSGNTFTLSAFDIGIPDPV